MTDRHLDGNGVAGLLGEVLAVDATTVRRTCQSCGNEHVLAEHRAYEGAGIALRCPGCGDVAVLVAVAGDELRVQWRGTYRVRRPA
jgi:ribosomal protein S27AE